METKFIEYKKEALKESIEFFTKDDYNQSQANEILAKILEVVRAHNNKRG